MKISVLMPTYNDCSTIEETLHSLMSQTYKDFELIIINDGSTDDTEKVILNFKKKFDKKDQIKYIFQENADQLNALKNGAQYITGDYVYILHSDDLLANKEIFKTMINYMKKNNSYDGIIADLIVIDKDSNVSGYQEVKNYTKKDYIIPLQLLFLGRNIYVDFTFIKKEIFLTNVFENYLTWNGPFWLNINNLSILNIKKVEFPFFKYRVFDGNYINNEIGLLNVANGEIRVVSNLMKNFYIPFYKLQYCFYRLFCEFNLKYMPIYFKRETRNKYKVLKFVYDKRFVEYKYQNYLYYDSLLKFFKEYKNREIVISHLPNKIYYGSDMRLFNKQMVNGKLEKFYIDIFNEMQKGFNKIIIANIEMEQQVVDITKFLDIYPYVTIEVRKEK